MSGPDKAVAYVPVLDRRTGAHYRVKVSVDLKLLGEALASRALRSKGRRSRLAGGAIEVKIDV